MNENVNTHLLVQEFAYLEPATLEEALALLNAHGEEARILAGGTDLLVHLKMERIKPGVLVSLRRIPGLDTISLEDDGLHLGALATIRSIRAHPDVARLYPSLAEACASFSTTQVQVMGTVGGNLCNGSPASDTAPALVAYGAEAVVRGSAGVRRLPVEELFRGPGKTVLGRGEILVEVILPASRAAAACEDGQRCGSAFLKIARVAADIAKASAAIALVREGDCIVSCRLAFGAVAPKPVRTRRAEMLLTGQVFSPRLAAEAARLASEEVTPIDDVRSTAWYRRQIVAVMAEDGLLRAWERAGAAQLPRAEPAPAATRHVARPERPAVLPAGTAPQDTLLVEHEIELQVNGVRRRLRVASNELLLSVLRERLELTGSKYGCGIGECGACTVLMDGQPVLACLVLAVSANGSEITTVEGLQAPDGKLDPLQEAFLEHAAFQCGFCTPGMLMTAKSLLRENPFPNEEQVRDYLKGNLCRCTGYASIVRAVMSCAGENGNA